MRVFNVISLAILINLLTSSLNASPTGDEHDLQGLQKSQPQSYLPTDDINALIKNLSDNDKSIITLKENFLHIINDNTSFKNLLARPNGAVIMLNYIGLLNSDQKSKTLREIDTLYADNNCHDIDLNYNIAVIKIYDKQYSDAKTICQNFVSYDNFNDEQRCKVDILNIIVQFLNGELKNTLLLDNLKKSYPKDKIAEIDILDIIKMSLIHNYPDKDIEDENHTKSLNSINFEDTKTTHRKYGLNLHNYFNARKYFLNINLNKYCFLDVNLNKYCFRDLLEVTQNFVAQPLNWLVEKNLQYFMIGAKELAVVCQHCIKFCDQQTIKNAETILETLKGVNIQPL